jgi:hypothetical protein
VVASSGAACLGERSCAIPARIAPSRIVCHVRSTRDPDAYVPNPAPTRGTVTRIDALECLALAASHAHALGPRALTLSALQTLDPHQRFPQELGENALLEALGYGFGFWPDAEALTGIYDGLTDAGYVRPRRAGRVGVWVRNPETENAPV